MKRIPNQKDFAWTIRIVRGKKYGLLGKVAYFIQARDHFYCNTDIAVICTPLVLVMMIVKKMTFVFILELTEDREDVEAVSLNYYSSSEG